MKILLCSLIIIVSLIRVQTQNPYFTSPILDSVSNWGLGGEQFLPEDSVTAVGLKQQLIRRYHYLEYIKTMYRELKEVYTRLEFVSTMEKKLKFSFIGNILTMRHCLIMGSAVAFLVLMEN